MQIQTTRNLRERVFRVAKPMSRQTQSGMRDRTRIAVADEWKNWMIKGRSGYLDGPTLGRIGIGRQNSGQHLPLLLDDKALVLEREIASFFHQFAYFRLFEKVFVKPSKLREHLEIGKVMDGEQLGNFGQIIAGTVKSLPQLAIAGIPANHPVQLRLE